VLEHLIAGFADIMTGGVLIWTALGVALGIAVGAVPGLNGPMAIAIAVPLTYYLGPLSAIAFLLGINKGGSFGGSIAAVLLNTPGSPEAAATALDGHPLARRGEARKALSMALYASVFGDLLATLCLIVIAQPLAAVALRTGPAELTAILLLSFTVIGGLVGDSLAKGLAAAALGVLFAMVGQDPVLGTPRLTFGIEDLQSGIPIMAIGIGLLALSEIFMQIRNHCFGLHAPSSPRAGTAAGPGLSWAELRGTGRTLLRSSAIGIAIGALPGIGSSIAAFLAYGAARRASRSPEAFGKGSVEGVAAPEAANSAVVAAAMIPVVSIGVPGSVAAAILMGAFIIHGVTPGPRLFTDHATLLYAIFAAMLAASLLCLAIGQIGLRLFVGLLRIPQAIIMPVLVLLCVTGAYLADNSLFAVGLTLFFGLLGFFMRLLAIPFVTFLIGFVLGPTLELAVSQTMILYGGHWERLLGRPVALAILAAAVAAVVLMVRARLR